MVATPYVDVVGTYGADNTGATDATAAIQNAINHAATISPSVVYFYQGVYKVSGVITLKPNVRLEAEPGAQINLSTAAQYAFVYNNTASTTPSAANIEFFNFVFNGTVANTYCFQISWCIKFDFINCSWTGVAKNIDANGVNWSRMQDCTCSGNATYPGGTLDFYAYPSPDTGTTYYTGTWNIENYRCLNVGNGFTGTLIRIQRAISFQITNIWCDDAHVGGNNNFLEIRGDCQGNVVTGGVIGASNIGIYLGEDLHNTSSTARPSFTTISGIQIDQAQYINIYDYGGSYNTFEACNLTTSGVAATYAIFLSPGQHDKVHNCQINGFSKSGAVGIQMGGATQPSHNVSIVGNTFSNCSECIGVVDTNAQRMLITNNNINDDCTSGIAFNPGGTYPYPTNIVRQNVGAPDIV